MNSRSAASITSSTQLKQWAVEELKIPGLAADCDLSSLCRGDMHGLWHYLVRYVTNGAKAKHIKDNIRLHKLQCSQDSSSELTGEKDPLQAKILKYKMLLQQVTKQQMEISEIEADIALQKRRLSSTSQAEHKVKSDVREVRVKTCLLSQHHDSISGHTVVLTKFRNNLELCLQAHDVERQRSLSVAANSGDHNKHLMSVRNFHKSFCDFLNLLLLGSLSKQQLQVERNMIKVELGKIMSSIGPAAVLEYIIHNINTSKERITQHTKEINYVKDAEVLRFRVVAQGLVDESVEPALDVGVAQLIEQAQVEHQAKFIETEFYRTEAVLVNKKVSNMKAAAIDQVKASLPDRDPKIRIIKDILDHQIAERQAKAALEVISSIKSTLDKQIQASAEKTAKLKQKEKEIANFRSDVHYKRNQICVLMKQNVGAKAKIDDKQGSLVMTLNTLASNAEPLATLGTTSIIQNYGEEVKQFHAIPLHYLSANPHTVVGTMLPLSGNIDKHVQQIFQILGFNSYKSSDAVVRSIMAKQADILQSHTRMSAVCNRAMLHDLLNRLELDLQPKAKQKNHDITRELVPLLERSKCLVDKGCAKCDKIDSLIEEWWKQPALKLNLR